MTIVELSLRKVSSLMVIFYLVVPNSSKVMGTTTAFTTTDEMSTSGTTTITNNVNSTTTALNTTIVLDETVLSTATTEPMATTLPNVSSVLLLSESDPPFQLWYTVLIGLSLLLVISMIFVMVVLLCRIVREKDGKKHTYSTTSRQGSIPLKGSVYYIRSQENLESTNAAPYQNLPTQAHVRGSQASESTVEEITGNQEEEMVHPAASASSRSGGTERSLRLSEEVTSEGIAEGTESEGEGHMYDVPFDNLVGSQQHQNTSSRQNMIDGVYDSDNSIHQDFHNNQPESFSQNIQESQHNRESGVETHATNLSHPSVKVTVAFEEDSHFQDIPGFHDPELKGDEENNNGLCVNVPPTIYSSQILSMVVHDQDEEASAGYNKYGTETSDMEMGTKSSAIPLHNIKGTPIDSPLVDFTCAVSDSSIPSVKVSEESSGTQSVGEAALCDESDWLKVGDLREGSRERVIIDSTEKLTVKHPDGVQPMDDDVLYDKPIITHGKTAKDSDDVNLEGIDPSTLFDDPGYTKGLGIQGGQAQQPSTMPADEVDQSSNTGAVSAQSLVPLQQAQSKGQELESGKKDSSEIKSLSVQLARVPGMKSSIDSLELLNFDESELENLDPVVASCLRTPILSDTDDEIAISEV